MIGSTFIFETDPDRLEILHGDPEALSDFAHVELEVLATLDFETMVADAGVRWMTGSPVFYDEAGGVALARISPESLGHILAQPHALEEEAAADLAALRAFVGRHGPEHIYELATF